MVQSFSCVKISEELEDKKRVVESLQQDFVDVTGVFKETKAKVIAKALERKHVVLGVKLEGFAGLLKRELMPDFRLGTEMADRARFWGRVGGIFHTDEMPAYGVTAEEIEELRKIKLNDAPGLFKIFMLHTTIDKAKGTLPIDAIECDLLPQADYYALGHLHIDFQYQNFVYPGPIFPNNFQELEDLGNGSFYIVDTEKENSLQKIELKIKETVLIDVEVKSAVNATDQIISEIEKRDVEDKIILLRVRGELETGNNSDIKFPQIEEAASRKKAYFLLKNTHELKTKEVEMEIEVRNIDNVEEESIKLYSEQNASSFNFNSLIPQLMHSLSIDKQEGEKIESFTTRLLEESKKILKF